MTDLFYMNKKIYYVGIPNVKERVVVQPGTYKYSFHCEIPDEYPTSVEERCGFIRYYVVVVIEEDDDKTEEFEEPFTVLSHLNLNHDVTFSYPMSEEIEQTFNTYGCLICCWETEPVKLTIRIPMRGYVPGQVIEITILADNKSNQTFDNFNARIFKEIEFYADGRSYSVNHLLSSSNCEGCPEKQSVSRKLCITVPPTPRSETSSACSISYMLKVVAFTSGCGDDPSVEFPITIGTYPIEKINARTNCIVVTQEPTSEKELHQGELNTKNIDEPFPSQPLLLEGNLHSHTSSAPQSTIEPPHFEVGASNLSDKELEYKPLYPVYRKNAFPITRSLQVQAVDIV